MEPRPAAVPGNVPLPPPPPPPPPGPPATLGPGSFRRVGRREDPGPSPLPGLPADVLHMRVREGSKIRNLLRFAAARMQGGGRDGALRQVVFTGSGRSLTKTITCVEILKRQVGGLHQVSKLCNKTVSEAWESLQEGVPGVTVCRVVAALSILLSKDPLDPQEPGYQPPLDPRDPRDLLEPRDPQPPLGLHRPPPEGPRRERAQQADPGGLCSQHMPSGAKRAHLEQGGRASTSSV